ncbi:uncharacterized protein BO80DRAFT_482432 [Aspergillus ibericus CBS 121593]|uniref:Uncharacterized protein n=1 Tax=Aspergillus ibericus CBS 121593 TaxID=1448316 RepID=A0A395GQI5_9EURO|nr:hypothetical protein BO80DRAFT_482432 [Aspergillus ibericus CBS 121593]RAK97208.1 hypothetical protein BO80DRAFT_482432 [Aspergillus ibericus CBS 121593]
MDTNTTTTTETTPSHPPDPSTTNPNTSSTTPRRSKFRFKDPHRKRHHHHNHHRHTSPTHTTTHTHTHTTHRPHRTHKPRPPHRPKHPSSSHPSSTPTAADTISPTAAFRESLFDALGDDEGAEYWESVYGQPIHTYSVPHIPKGPNGELEAMDEEEYATYVRTRMWERTREGMEAERERLRAERARVNAKEREREREKERERERVRFEVEVEESLRRGRERRRREGWGVVWGRYCAGWKGVEGLVRENGDGSGNGGGGEGKKGEGFAEVVFWPVESGRREDLGREEVQAFMRGCAGVAGAGTGAGEGNGGLLGLLKTERVRWHPDKIQHRYGSLGLDESVIRSVTEVFQMVDQMWNEERKKQSD